MKQIKDFYKEIKNYEDFEIFFKNNKDLCVAPGQKLDSGAMQAEVVEVSYTFKTHSITIKIDNGQIISRQSLVKMIEAGQIKEI